MKVLMLGWEFPPHISGGLGTACYGLTQGLGQEQVEVLFVVPRAHGDEDPSHARILGCNRAVFPEIRTHTMNRGEAPGPSGPDQSQAEEPGQVSREVLQETLTMLTVESGLSPYLDEDSYQLHQERQRVAEASRARREGSQQSEQELARLGELLSGMRESGLGILTEFLDTARDVEFSGVYGPDLYAEVARYALSVCEIARHEEFDVIHAHDWMTYAAGVLAKEISRKPLVVHLHASEFDRSGENQNERVRALEQLGFSGADRIACVSHYTAGVLQRNYELDAAKLRIVHNAVLQDPESDADLIPQPGETANEKASGRAPIVLFLGRVTFQKGPDYFLEAARKVVSINPRVKFVMAGSGDMWPGMVERAASMGLARNLHFTGFLRGKDVKRMFAMADLYVMPSVSEPFGISPLEAMAADVPVIVSKQSGVSEILANALKVDFWDVDELANKILAVLEYGALRNSLLMNGRKEVRQIRWDKPARLVKEIYTELIP